MLAVVTVFDIGLGFGRFGRRHHRRGKRLLAEGTPGRGRIVGIKVRGGREHNPDVHEYAIVLDDGRRLGCRQRLPDGARLGCEVDVRVDGRLVIVVLPDREAWGWKAVEPPPDGVDDDRHRMDRERRKGSPVSLTVLAVEPVTVLGMPALNVDIVVRVDGRYDAVVKNALVPTYATHLAEPGTVLPGYVRASRPDRVRVDWPSAASA